MCNGYDLAFKPDTGIPAFSCLIRGRWLMVLLLLFINLFTYSQKPDFHIADNEPFWFVYQPFDGYHADFAEIEPLFRQELKRQGLDTLVRGEAFNIYLSEDDWAIGCRLQKRTEVHPPLKTHYRGNGKAFRARLGEYERNVPLVLERAGSFITGQNYYWDGYVYLHPLPDDTSDHCYELVIPVSRDYYGLFIRPYGIVRIVITFFFLLFAVFLFSYRKGRVLSNRILGFLLISFILINCSSFLWIYKLNDTWPHLYNFAISLDFLPGPLLFLYTLSVVKPKFSFKPVYFLHFLLFATVAVTYFLIFQVHTAAHKLSLMHHNFDDVALFEWGGIVQKFQITSYLLISLFIVFRYPLKTEYGHLRSEKRLLFTLKFLLIGMLSLLIVGIIRNEIVMARSMHYFIKAVSIVLDLALVFTLIVRSLLYPEMFAAAGKNGNGGKYHKSPLTREHKNHYLKRIISYMDEAQPYLSSSVNLTDFAAEISIPSRYLSQVLNEEVGMSFYDFMNKYRIDKAGQMLSDPVYSDSSIIDIAWDCGFNSKSVFNAAFKKHTGMTPTEYRLDKRSVPIEAT